MPKAMAVVLGPLAPLVPEKGEESVIVYLLLPRSTDPLQFVQGLAALRGHRFLYTETGSEWSVAIELPRQALAGMRQLPGARFLGYGYRHPKAGAGTRQ